MGLILGGVRHGMTMPNFAGEELEKAGSFKIPEGDSYKKGYFTFQDYRFTVWRHSSLLSNADMESRLIADLVRDAGGFDQFMEKYR